ncbi:hypothetical protein RH915_08130 [Serpentinicella sp. ANB-PHB4]|uniref:hypothetical protein n=1 Tax=Serpentinicella sp. ANB-PHB4 TaxID=3074076 RepID=UPI0028669FF3|nr:hypothetical protein [Serpentinicella sp. ANB-PHB4]MDR5659457.1 hypothetical protein [Serpentinicella sp. ANB-PHB4]
MKEYTYFSAKKLTFIDQNNETQQVPEFVTRSAKNYRFNHVTNKLEKKCIECKNYFEVQLYENGKFIDIHDEEEIHFYSEKSGYDTRCRKCKLEKASKEPNTEYQLEKTEKYQLENKLSADNIMYIRIVAAIEHMDEEQCLNYLLDLVRKTNTLTYDYKRKLN